MTSGRPGDDIVAITNSARLVSQWPRALAERLNARHLDNLGVVSTALAGNRLLFNSAGTTGPETQWDKAYSDVRATSSARLARKS